MGEVRLTRRELEVLEIMATGIPAGKIAHKLFLSKRTIDFHTAHIYEKLGVHSKLAALLAARQLGFITF